MHSTMNHDSDNLWESFDDTFLPYGNLDSLTSAHCGAKRPCVEDGTIVTKETHDSDGFDSSSEDADNEEYLEDDDDSQFLSYANGVPAEVKVSFHEDDNDDSCHQNCDSDSEPSDAESEEELDTQDSEEEGNDDDSVDHDSADEYETDEDSVESESERSEDGDLMDNSSCCSASSRSNGRASPLGDASQHELFLPWDVSPSVQSLKYEEDDESSDEEDEVPQYSHRTYMIGNSGRPRMWDGCPSSISVSSSSSSSVGSCPSRGSKSSKGSSTAAKSGVSFNDSVTVYPVFETTVYTSSTVQGMYTKRDELRVNKLRNKREFAYDMNDWKNASEEVDMEPNDMGELVHPVHLSEKNQPAPRCRTRNVVQTYSSALGGYNVGSMNSSGLAHRAKRMRMYYP